MAAGSLLKGVSDAARRFVGILADTDEEWNLVAGERPALGDVLFPFAAMGMAVFVAFFSLGYLFRSNKTSFAVELAFALVTYALAPAVFAAAASHLAGRMKAVRRELCPVVCVYAFSPAWVVSILNIIPVVAFGWLWFIISIVFISIIFFKGAQNVIGVPPAKTVPFNLLSLAAVALTMFAGILMKFLWLISQDIY